MSRRSAQSKIQNRKSTIVEARLRARVAERDALLERARMALERDERVVAAWLFGSLGRGEADALSDLDLFVVVADDRIDAVIKERHAFMEQLGTPLLILEGPQNAPPHGAYNMALYDGRDGPHQVDWYWQARSATCIPRQTRLLLDRVGLPCSDSPPQFDSQPVPERDRLEGVAQAVSFFWVMLLITAKYAARSPDEERMGLLKWVYAPLAEVEQFLGVTPIVEDESPHPNPAHKLRLLRELAGRMESLMPRVVAAGAPVPFAVVPSAHRYLDLVEAVITKTGHG